MHQRVLAIVLATTLALPVATALTISNTRAFAYTHNDAVSWTTSAPIEATSVTVTATTLSINSVGLNFAPGSNTPTSVMIESWGADLKTFTVQPSSPATVLLTVTNPGFKYLIKSDPVSATCPATVTTCTLDLGSGTSFFVTIKTVDESSGSDTTPPPSPPSLAPVPGPTPAASPAGVNVPLPNVGDLTSHLTGWHIFGLVLGGVLFLGGSRRGRIILPPIVRALLTKISPNPHLLLALGALLVLMIYVNVVQAAT